MTTTEYLKQRGNDLLDFFGIKPASSVVIKNLMGEVIAIEHRLPKAEEKEFIGGIIQGMAAVPAVFIERVQFPNNLDSEKAIKLEKAIRSDQIGSYSKKNEYVYDSNFEVSLSLEDWEKQIWTPKPTIEGDEYLVAVRDKKTPNKDIIGYTKYPSEKEINIDKDLLADNSDVEICIYKIYDKKNFDYKRAEGPYLQRYLDDPRSYVDFIRSIDVPDKVLIFQNDTTKLFSGKDMLMDFYKMSFDKSGTVSIVTTYDIEYVKEKISQNVPLNQIPDATIEKRLYAPELSFYIQDCLKNQKEVKNSILSNDTVISHSQEYFADYRKFLNDHKITEIERSSDYICEALKHNTDALRYLTESEKPNVEMWKEIMESPMFSDISAIPKEYITFDFLRKTNYHEPEIIYKYLPENITNEQIMNLIAKDSNIVKEKWQQENSAPSSIYNCIKCIPNELKNKDFVSEIYRSFNDTPAENEAAYSIVIQDLEQPNNFTALKAMNYFSDNRFNTEYDPIGADNSWGQVCGCDYYINEKMANPADKFDPNLLTIKQWHDIASQDTRMIEFIPETIIKNDAFWENFQDFIGKGGFLNHPKNEYKMDNFDEYQVFSKMPEHLKTNPDICSVLLKQKAVSISFVENPNENHYLLVNPNDYDRIPIGLREKDSFKELALNAFLTDKWKISDIPEKFITKEMVSEALSYDMALCKKVPIHYLSEDLLIDIIKKHEHQGVFSDIRRSGEHPQYIEQELTDHNTVLQYVPEKLKTDRVCREALKANPGNAAFLPNNHHTKIKSSQSRKQENTGFLHPKQTKELSNSNNISNQRRKGPRL